MNLLKSIETLNLKLSQIATVGDFQVGVLCKSLLIFISALLTIATRASTVCVGRLKRKENTPLAIRIHGTAVSNC